MDIHLVSSFTDEDEDRFANVLLKTMSELLVAFPIAYNLRIETASGRVFQHGEDSTGFRLPAAAPVGSRKREITGR